MIARVSFWVRVIQLTPVWSPALNLSFCNRLAAYVPGHIIGKRHPESLHELVDHSNSEH